MLYQLPKTQTLTNIEEAFLDMVKSEENKIKQVLDQIDLSDLSFFNDSTLLDDDLRKRYEQLSKELGVSETLLYKEALNLFINLESEWLGEHN